MVNENDPRPLPRSSVTNLEVFLLVEAALYFHFLRIWSAKTLIDNEKYSNPSTGEKYRITDIGLIYYNTSLA